MDEIRVGVYVPKKMGSAGPGYSRFYNLQNLNWDSLFARKIIRLDHFGPISMACKSYQSCVVIKIIHDCFSVTYSI